MNRLIIYTIVIIKFISPITPLISHAILLIVCTLLTRQYKEPPMSKSKSATPTTTLMTQTAAARIQSAVAKENGGQVPAGSFAARAMSAAAKNTGK